MDFLPKEIEAYAERFTRKEGDVLAALNRETYAKMMMPRMLSGHLQGQLLRMFSQMMRPRYILEIGTFTGYSAICLADGLRPGGKLITIDNNLELEEIADRYITMSGKHDAVQRMAGNALEVIPTVDGGIDLVFIDADKENYGNYYDLVFDKVNPGGHIIADNVLWSGKVLQEDAVLDKDTIALKEFALKVDADPRVENLLLPVRDGLLIARKMA